MKTISKHNSKFAMDFKNVLQKHIKINMKDYLVLSIIFIIGVMIGVIIINNSDEQSKIEINGYINSFIDTIKNNSLEIDKVKLTKIAIWENLKIIFIIWIAGSTVIGIPLIYIITAYKGLCIGYTVSAIISTLGTWKRFCFFTCFIIFAKYNHYSYNTNVKCKCFKII